MLKLVLMRIKIILIILCATATQYVIGIQIDNQLVSAKNDCFERIVLEAMIPYEKTFHTAVTNSVRICEKLCIAEGQRCQSYAIGIHVRGNGTCLLSSVRIDASTGRRPAGTIYDPDFDIYQRQEDCAISDPNIPKPGGLGNSQGGATFPPQSSDRPTSPNFSTTLNVPSTTPDRFPTLSTTLSTGSTTNVRPLDTQRPSSSLPPPRPSYSSNPLTTRYPNNPSTRYPIEDRYPSTERYPIKDRYPTSEYGNSNTYATPDKLHPYDDSFPTVQTGLADDRYPSSFGYPNVNQDRLHFYQDIYPTYAYPMLYEHNYPKPNVQFPSVYAQNVPTIEGNYYRPTFSSTSTNYDRPTVGYESEKQMGQHRPSNRYPPNGYDNVDRKPTGGNMPTNGYGGDRNPMNGNGYDNRHPMNGNGYDNRNPTNGKEGYGNGTGESSFSNDRNTNQPINNENHYGPDGSKVLYKPSQNAQGGYDGLNQPEGNYHVTEEPIETYFNPDDYYHMNDRKPSAGDVTGTSVGNYGSSFAPVRPSLEDNRPCFRRALAGKRIAPQWVRRTLACERVEDCQTECGHEKRFTCEGFNYRLDPSGRGQGVCELIEVPLSEMDLYSSTHNRDENLLFHPDYDYYERDRNACRPTTCIDCIKKPYGGRPSGPSDSFRPTTYRPETASNFNSKPYLPDSRPPPSSIDSTGYGSPPEHYRPSTAIDKYRPPIYENRPPPSIYESRPPDYDRYDISGPPSSSDVYRPSSSDGYRPSDGFRPPPSESGYRPSHESGYRPESPDSGFRPSYDDGYRPPMEMGYRPSSYGSNLDRYDTYKPIEISRPGYQEVIITPDHGGYGPSKEPSPNPFKEHYSRPDFIPIEDYRPNYRPSNSDRDYPGPFRPEYEYSGGTSGYRDRDRDRPPSSRPDRYPSPSHYLDRDPPPYRKPTLSNFIPYTIGEDKSWGSYGGSYGGSSYSKYSSDYWGFQNEVKRKDGPFNYNDLGGNRPSMYGQSMYGSRYEPPERPSTYKDKLGYGSIGTLWTRRPGQDECSVKSSEGFRLHKGIVGLAYNVPTVTECERMCHSEDKFRCVTYSYRYSPLTRDNCLLCDRPVNLLDYYADIEPDRDYDIYTMSDDPQMCSKELTSNRQNNAQCFFRAIDTSRFFKSIVRDSLTVRSVGECEMECIKSNKFTCRAFSFRYGAKSIDSVIDNCQLSDWPVRDMDKERHLVHDVSFDVFERASYGHGCEIQPIIDDKHKKLCYLGYGSPSKLLSSAIKKVISVQSELECKNECIRFRENTPFKCYSFSFGSQVSTFNCEMSDLDQSELKLNVHYSHTNDRDYWLFAWNPFDWTCRDKVTTIGGGNRVNNDRRMDIFREPGQNTWTHFTVSGKACRVGSGCEKNILTGFYSCEIESGEIGSWDYCCKTDHPCGYSQGFDYPWCFVGDTSDQWRTCSDRYFPSNSNKKHSAAITYSPAGSSSNKKITAIKLNKKGDQYQQPPPRPGGLQKLEEVAAARLWPVTYLYSSGPPNSTELSNFVDCNKESC